MSSATSRRAAAEAADKDDDVDLEPAALGPGLRDWIRQLPAPTRSQRAVAFDTRIDKPALLTGSAAKGFSRELRRRRYESFDEATSFFVEDSEGPLKYGEAARARSWGEALGAKYRQSTPVS